MKVLVLYSSLYGNTEKIAKAVVRGFSRSNDVSLSEVEELNYADLQKIDLLIAGSPTQGGRPMQSMQDFLNEIPEEIAKKLQFACFDTRMDPVKQNLIVKTVMNIVDYAAPKMDKLLSEKGGKWVIVPEGFIVEDKEGPLREGETERAERWAKKIIAKVGAHLSAF